MSYGSVVGKVDTHSWRHWEEHVVSLVSPVFPFYYSYELFRGADGYPYFGVHEGSGENGEDDVWVHDGQRRGRASDLRRLDLNSARLIPLVWDSVPSCELSLPICATLAFLMLASFRGLAGL